MASFKPHYFFNSPHFRLSMISRTEPMIPLGKKMTTKLESIPKMKNHRQVYYGEKEHEGKSPLGFNKVTPFFRNHLRLTTKRTSFLLPDCHLFILTQTLWAPWGLKPEHIIILWNFLCVPRRNQLNLTHWMK